MALQLGLDTGGTYTDAVLVDESYAVRRSAKSLTTHRNLLQGLRGAVTQIVTAEDTPQIKLVCLSTTLATNALVEGRGRSVALVLIGFNKTQLARANLSQALAGDPMVLVSGGHSADGKPHSTLDVESVREFVLHANSHVDAFAVSALFAVRNPEHELQVQLLIESMTGKPVTCGHHLSSGLDAPRRALTALLNARLIPMITTLLDATQYLLTEQGIKAPLMVVKGDGSLISDAVARRYPVETILSGPAASIVGAQFMCGSSQLLVADMGGTTTDVALVEHGQPRLSREGATVGGWRTMVSAIDVRTYGLGGDSAVVFDRDTRNLQIGPNRVVPLSLLAEQNPEILPILEAQLSLPMSTTHSAQFVMVHSVSPTDLTFQQQELFDQLVEGPVAVQTLFKDQTQERALQRLEQRGVVIRAGFTPTDACHITGLQTSWSSAAAIVGARLLMRYSEDNLGAHYADEHQFALTIQYRTSELTALALADALSASTGSVLSTSQRDLIEKSFHVSDKTYLSLSARLHVPIVGLGAPAASYYPHTASLLNTELQSPEHAHVANALGAVVGSVRQEQVIVIAPTGGKRVTVLFPDGALQFDTLEAGAEAAITEASRLAVEKATQAGASEPSLSVDRVDNTVKEGGEEVFFESRITVTASGRPSV